MDRTTHKKDDSLASPPSPASNIGNNVAEFTVSELSNAVKRALEEGFGHVRLRGEVSGYRGPHASGHCYFSLKDEKAKIDAVVWKGNLNRLKIKPEEGMEVIATGKISSFPGSSKYQIVIEALEPAGLGALMEGRKVWRRIGTGIAQPDVLDPASAASAPPPLHDAEYRYESMSRFTATVRDDEGRPIVFVLTRDGLRWRLSDIRLPL